MFRGKVDDYVLEVNNQTEGDEEISFIVNDVGKNFEKAEEGGGDVIIDKEDDIIKIVK